MKSCPSTARNSLQTLLTTARANNPCHTRETASRTRAACMISHRSTSHSPYTDMFYEESLGAGPSLRRIRLRRRWDQDVPRLHPRSNRWKIPDSHGRLLARIWKTKHFRVLMRRTKMLLILDRHILCLLFCILFYHTRSAWSRGSSGPPTLASWVVLVALERP